jgi:hypothetical protein
MPRRELLTPTERLQLLAFPEDEAALIRLATLSKDDMAFIRQHRGEHNRLGIAVLMTYLRYPGRVLGEDEEPHAPVLKLISAQLEVSTDAWPLYAQRDETRREHLLELVSRLAMEQFGTNHYRSLSSWLEPTALQTTRGILLVQAVVEELRRRLVILPPLAVIERLCAEAATRAQRKVFSLLTKDLNSVQRTKLDNLLELRAESPYSNLSWLRAPPGAPTARAVLAHIERLKAIRDIGISPESAHRLHQNRLLQVAREAGQTAAYQLKEYEQDRRHGTLVALMIETGATLTDDRSFENQRHRASGLNLIVAAITLWNTVYLERAAEMLAKSREFDPALLKHVSPLGWEHVNLTGDYTWHTNKRVAKGGYRPLRVVKTA